MSEDNHRFEPSDEISFEGDEEPSQEFRFHMLDAFAHAAGHGPHPGKYRAKPEDTKEGPAETKPRETTEEFCKRLGIKRNNRRGGVQFCPGTFLVKQLKSQGKRNDGD
jgi:hypothetical protein